jgi:O-antigen ligase
MHISNRLQLAVARLPQITPGKFLVIGLPVFLGVGLGLLIAFGQWFYAAIFVLAMPIVLLLIGDPFIAVIIWLITIPLLSIFPNQNMLYWVLHRLMIPVCLVLAILAQQFRPKKHFQIKLGPAELAMIVFLVLVIVSIAISRQDPLLPSPQKDAVAASISLGGLQQDDAQGPYREAVDRILIPFCIYLLIRFAAPREKAYKLLVITALFLVLSQSIINLAATFVSQILPSQLISSIYGSYRSYGSVGDPNLFTSILVFSMILLFQDAMNRRPGLVRFVFLLACGFCAINILFSFERGSWLGGLFVVIGLLILYPKPILRLGIPFVVIITIFSASVFSKQISYAFARIQEVRTINDRLVIYDALIQMIEHKPLFGWGYETVDRFSSQFYRSVGNAPVLNKYLTSHNTYLTIMAELGLVGFIFFIFPFAYWLVKSIRVWPRLPATGTRSRPMLVVLWLAALHFFIVSNTMDMRFFSLGLGLWWLTLGLIANLVYPYIKPDIVHSIKATQGQFI